MTVIDKEAEVVATSIHHAIDQVTILKIELRQLRQRLHNGEVIELERLLAMETALAHVAAVLIECRDRDDSST